MLNLIVAQAQNRVIGRDNMIPWRLRADLIKLKQLTIGQVVVLGRKTYQSMDEYYTGSGRPMPGKEYLVVSRNATFAPLRENARAVSSLTEALQEAAGADVYVIGGAQIFAEALPVADRIYLTEVKSDIAGDSYFPELDPKQWHAVNREAHPADEKNDFPYEFVTYERI